MALAGRVGTLVNALWGAPSDCGRPSILQLAGTRFPIQTQPCNLNPTMLAGSRAHSSSCGHSMRPGGPPGRLHQERAPSARSCAVPALAAAAARAHSSCPPGRSFAHKAERCEPLRIRREVEGWAGPPPGAASAGGSAAVHGLSASRSGPLPPSPWPKSGGPLFSPHSRPGVCANSMAPGLGCSAPAGTVHNSRSLGRGA